jgi:K+/H+ antiporter YhaU regulatory subunit KhtT
VTNNGETMVNPGADFVLQAGSSLVLWGDSEQIEVAEKLLGPEKVTPEDD